MKKQILSPRPDDMRWQVTESEYLFRQPWLTVRRDRCLLPTGAVVPDYYVLEYPDWVNVIAITTNGEFVMVEQYRHGLQCTEYELCAGVCEPDEAPLTAARRELMEETGFGGGTWQPFMTISANPSTMNNLTHCFLATGVERVSSQHLDATEDIRVRLFSRDEVRALVATDGLKQATMAAPLWKYFALQT